MMKYKIAFDRCIVPAYMFSNNVANVTKKVLDFLNAGFVE